MTQEHMKVPSNGIHINGSSNKCEINGSRSNSPFDYTGRKPWSLNDGNSKQAYVIGIAGGSASGKTSVSNKIVKRLGSQVASLPMDAFYRTLSKEDTEKAFRNEYNFDQPSSIDNDLIYECIKKLKQGNSVDIPVYDFASHSRLPGKYTTIQAANIIIYEGIFAFCDERIRNTMDLKIFVDTDSDIRLARRIKRDVYERGRDVEGILQQYARFVKPSFENFIYPTMKFADVIVPRGKENLVAIELITRNILCQLEARGIDMRPMLSNVNASSELPSQVMVLPSSGQLRALHTIIRNRETQASDFIFYSDRLSSLVIERALAELPHFEKIVETPCGKTYHGATWAEHICGVSVLPSGATMDAGLRRVCKDIHIGHLLIESSKLDDRIKVVESNLPDGIQDQIVFLMGSSITTGESSLLAIQFLKDHNILESQIVFLCQIATPMGLHAIAKAYPEVRIIVSEVGESFKKDFHIRASHRNGLHNSCFSINNI